MSFASENMTATIKTEEGEKKEVDFEAVLAFLRQRGLRETETLLQRELNVASSTDPARPGVDPNAGSRPDPSKPIVTPATGETGSEVTNVLTSYKSDGDPAIYGDAYQVSKNFWLLTRLLIYK